MSYKSRALSPLVSHCQHEGLFPVVSSTLVSKWHILP